MKVALQNPHKIMNVHNVRVHNYVMDLIASGFVTHIYISDFSNINFILACYNFFKDRPSGFDFNFKNIKFIFSFSDLSKCDVLLNFSAYPNDCNNAVRKFDGLKIFHIGDYFYGFSPDEKLKSYVEAKIDYVFSYSNSDLYCSYFKSHFKPFIGKVIPLPFGYSGRFHNSLDFSNRENKAFGSGSVNPMRPIKEKIEYWKDAADFFPDLSWTQPFRRQVVNDINRNEDIIFSMFPLYPDTKSRAFDIAKYFNKYKIFFACESVFNFAPAKYYEGIACGSVLIASDHPCNINMGFKGNKNAILYHSYDDFLKKLRYFLLTYEGLTNLQDIHINSLEHSKRFTHERISSYIKYQVIRLHSGSGFELDYFLK